MPPPGRETYDHFRITRNAELVRDLDELGGTTLRPPRRRFGFEQRLERADERPRVERGSYIGADAPGWDEP